jgi:hypothetical protein
MEYIGPGLLHLIIAGIFFGLWWEGKKFDEAEKARLASEQARIQALREASIKRVSGPVKRVRKVTAITVANDRPSTASPGNSN